MSETKMYSVLDKWTDLEKENIVDFTSVDGVVTETKVNGVPAGGGGVTTRTITGTLANPFGDIEDWEALAVDLYNGNASGILFIDISAFGLPGEYTALIGLAREGYNKTISTYFCNIGEDSVLLGIDIEWSCSRKEANHAMACLRGNIQNLTPYLSNIPTTLTLYEVG